MGSRWFKPAFQLPTHPRLRSGEQPRSRSACISIRCKRTAPTSARCRSMGRSAPPRGRRRATRSCSPTWRASATSPRASAGALRDGRGRQQCAAGHLVARHARLVRRPATRPVGARTLSCPGMASTSSQPRFRGHERGREAVRAEVPGVADRAVAARQEAFGGRCQFDLEGLVAVGDGRNDALRLRDGDRDAALARQGSPAVATYSGGPAGGDVTSGSTRSATD